jgi:SAM-dependent methyltransferase
MLPSPRYSEYDAFAWLYDRYWGTHFIDRYWDVVERLFLSQLGPSANILDLCCGSGQLARKLSEAGHRVSGIDGSASLLRFARKNAPKAEFSTGDARTFTIVDKFDGVISSFDSLNHVMNLVSLGGVFNNVYSALKKNGVFLFDMNMEEGYKARWRGSASVTEADHVLATNAEYRSDTKEASTRITYFVEERRRWMRTDVTLVERCYPREDVATRLSSSLFRAIKTYDSRRDLNHQETGRCFFLCAK